MATEMERRRAVLTGAEEYLLPDPSHWSRLIARRAALRAAWRQGPGAAEAVLAPLGLSADAILVVAPRDCPNDIAFVERAHRLLDGRGGPPRLVPLGQALAEFDSTTAGP